MRTDPLDFPSPQRLQPRRVPESSHIMRLQIDTSPRAVQQTTSGQHSAHGFRSKTPDPTSAASGHSTFSRESSPNLLSPAPSSSSSSPIDTHPIRHYTPSPSPSLSEDGDPDYVLAMHDFIPDHRNATCLAFHAGQVIHVLNRDPSGWWDGEVDGRRGWFPSNYVATTAVASSLTEEVFPEAEVCLLSLNVCAQSLK
jgi:son of sevenless-like protein